MTVFRLRIEATLRVTLQIEVGMESVVGSRPCELRSLSDDFSLMRLPHSAELVSAGFDQRKCALLVGALGAVRPKVLGRTAYFAFRLPDRYPRRRQQPKDQRAAHAAPPLIWGAA